MRLKAVYNTLFTWVCEGVVLCPGAQSRRHVLCYSKKCMSACWCPCCSGWIVNFACVFMGLHCCVHMFAFVIVHVSICDFLYYRWLLSLFMSFSFIYLLFFFISFGASLCKIALKSRKKRYGRLIHKNIWNYIEK